MVYNGSIEEKRVVNKMLEEIKTVLANHLVQPVGEHRYFSVLLPLIKVGDELHILYEVRGHNISQPGETSFPGGSVELDETFEETAIRETMEELNLSRGNIRILGEMDYIVNEYAIIHCFVGEIVNIKLEDIHFNEEVQELFTMPLAYFVENKPTYYSSTVQLDHPEDFPFELIPNGKDYKFRIGVHSVPFYHLENHRLWGFTANLTDRFISILDEEKVPLKDK